MFISNRLADIAVGISEVWARSGAAIFRKLAILVLVTNRGAVVFRFDKFQAGDIGSALVMFLEGLCIAEAVFQLVHELVH